MVELLFLQQMVPQVDKKEGYILVVDDEEDILRVIRSGLEKYGHKVVTFSNPTAALEEFKLNYESYSLLLTDVRMPGLSGIDFAKQAKGIQPSIKIIVMSAFELSTYELNQDLPFIKVEDVLRKPFLLNRMCQIVDSHIDTS
jgi:two-component system catabolic regulation response regulator CreB/two-component system response regulator ChvI